MANKAIVIGAGIVGLATARALSLKGYTVTVIERTDKAVGASIRNFGMVWPIGQPAGELYNRALRSKEIWKEAAQYVGINYNECGSLHTAYFNDEWIVLQELYEIFKAEGRSVTLLNPAAIIAKYPAVNPAGLIGGLFSDSEMIVDPRAAIAGIPTYLTEVLKVQFIWGKCVTAVELNKVYMGKESLEADLIFICNGADFETLYPELFNKMDITKCKLQMMRFKSSTNNFDLGVSLCGGLSLIHYSSFKAASSLAILKNRYETEMPEYVNNGIHVMVSQNNGGELTVGDSHEYGLTHDPFDRTHINELILNYLKQFALTNDWQLFQSWNGIYPKMTNGENHIFLNPHNNIYILNGLGGAGMTLSFGLAEEIIDKI
ncbi:MAG: TIGR03364 family FAD-dependent oxidoreductase [Sediminibacterium sp.]|nr:TIGR03364 family FAD-dependent oxidoreductase [Sediminibacterium sp.]TXT34612.1 MAG: FAD dependent oxidoreductase [Chitinophagaceae bacterium]